MSAAIASTQRVHPLTPVAAYPELVYGWSPFFGIASRQAATLRFPIALDALVRRQRPDPVLSTDYVLCGSCLNRGPIDLAYDLWISRGRSPVWCGHGAAPALGCVPTPSNVIEVMIWLAHSRTFAPAGRPRPAWFTAGAWLDGRKSLMAFRMYACTSCSHDIVSFVLAGGPSGKLPRGLLHGLISLPLDAFLRQAWLRTGRRAGYLDGIELGSEIAPAHDGDPTRFWFTLRRYWLSSGAPAPSS